MAAPPAIAPLQRAAFWELPRWHPCRGAAPLARRIRWCRFAHHRLPAGMPPASSWDASGIILWLRSGIILMPLASPPGVSTGPVWARVPGRCPGLAQAAPLALWTCAPAGHTRLLALPRARGGRRGPFGNYSWRRASMGLSLAALWAGKNPKTTPTAKLTPKAMATEAPETRAGQPA